MTETQSIVSRVLDLQHRVILALDAKVKTLEKEVHRLRFVRGKEDEERARAALARCGHTNPVVLACSPKTFHDETFCRAHPNHDWPCPHR